LKGTTSNNFHNIFIKTRQKEKEITVLRRIRYVIIYLIMGGVFYLGFDLSTQQLKCLAIDEHRCVVGEQTVEFDKDLPQYETEKGVYHNGDVVDSPVAQWLEAFDLVLQRFVDAGHDLSKVVAISGSCQQHGSVYWTEEACELLENLQNGIGSLKDQLASTAFARPTAPNWQDHSTGKQCQEMEDSVGGPQEMARITGSRAHFRFTGPQILKIIQEEPDIYERSHVITLVSNFATSLLCGKFVPLEEADACGMNLYDIQEKKFSEPLVQLLENNRQYKVGNSLLSKLLGEPMSAGSPLRAGVISQYFVDKYGFNSNCSVFPFTGDNLATICSLPLRNNDVLISLGTSTTVLLVTDQYHPSPNYHLFIHPTIPDHYMGMICYCNGSLAREQIRDQLNVVCHDKKLGNWLSFNEAVSDDNIANDNELAIYFPLGEIVPSVPATCQRVLFENDTGEILQVVDNFNDLRHDAKNIVESQALSCRVRVSPLLTPRPGAFYTSIQINTMVKFDYDELPLTAYFERRPAHAYFVGGASKNLAIVKRFSQVLGATESNFRSENPNSCAVGGCYKAMWSYLQQSESQPTNFGMFLKERFQPTELQLVIKGDDKAWDKYNRKIVALSRLEQSLQH